MATASFCLARRNVITKRNENKSLISGYVCHVKHVGIITMAREKLREIYFHRQVLAAFAIIIA